MTKTTNSTFAANRISLAFAAAQKSEQNYVAQAIICGQMMIEQLSELKSGKPCRSNNGNRFTTQDQLVTNWLAENCPSIPERTGRHYRLAAARAVSIITESHHTEPVVWLDFVSQKFYVSTVLTTAPGDASPEMLTFQETFQRFLADKTISEVIRCALNGCDAAHNIDRANNGKTKGGTRGENRRDYAKFITVHFKELGHLIGRWDKFIEKDPSQHAKMTEAMRNIILGGKIKIEEKGRPIDMPGWPASFATLIRDLTKERLRTGAED